MVQKEVRKKAQVYGLMAILLASMCVALIYTVGTGPGISTNPNPSPGTANQVSPMKTFSSYDELKTFLAAGQQGGLSGSPQGGVGYFTSYSRNQLSAETNGMPVPAPTAMPAAR